jgi:S-adenosylmethionine synthetase
MSLNKTILKNSIVTALQTAIVSNGGVISEGNTDKSIDSIAQAIANAVIDHLQSSATVIGVCPPTGGALIEGRIE